MQRCERKKKRKKCFLCQVCLCGDKSQLVCVFGICLVKMFKLTKNKRKREEIVNLTAAMQFQTFKKDNQYSRTLFELNQPAQRYEIQFKFFLTKYALDSISLPRVSRVFLNFLSITCAVSIDLLLEVCVYVHQTFIFFTHLNIGHSIDLTRPS